MGKSSQPRICIIVPGYISSTPRVVKEADALYLAGFDVRIVFTQGNLERVRAHDELLLKEKPWRWKTVGWSPFRREERWLYHKSRLRQHIAQRFPLTIGQFVGDLTEVAEGRVYKELAQLAAKERADMYIGHYPAGLAAAANAAKYWNTKLGYDVEDLHTAELPTGKSNIKQTERIRTIENRYLSSCSHITAVSELVADEIVSRYQIKRPIVIHNVFPWSDRDNLDGQFKDRTDFSTPSLYWYSQTIGEGRGIEDMIRAAGLLHQNVQIHLRGSISAEIRANFEALACQNGVGSQIFFHSPVPPSELLSRAVEHDIGLAIEQPISLSRMLSVTNKLFFYLLAGLAIVATDIPGQRYVLESCPGVGVIYPPGDAQALAAKLATLLADPGRLKLCKRNALEFCHVHWSWEQESRKLIENVARVFGLSKESYSSAIL